MTDYIGWALIALVALFLGKRLLPVKGLTDLDAASYQIRYKEAAGGVLVDVRETAEYRSGHIRGAVNIPLSQFHTKLDSLPKDKPIFVYCQSGMRSKSAGKQLVKHGFTPVYNLRGGIMRWPDRLV